MNDEACYGESGSAMGGVRRRSLPASSAPSRRLPPKKTRDHTSASLLPPFGELGWWEETLLRELVLPMALTSTKLLVTIVANRGCWIPMMVLLRGDQASYARKNEG